LVLIVILIAIAVGIGYRKKRLTESSQIAEFKDPADCEGVACLYVSTVFASSPLRRVLAHGMGPRGRASVSIGQQGISVCRQGERGFLIPRESLVGVEKSTATIDRAVEPGGLTSIAWIHDSNQLVTNVRFQNRQEREMFEKEVYA
jgi:hypothetical protein